MGGSDPGGVRDCAGSDGVVIEPRLCENWSGRGREWVLSNKPHLLQSWHMNCKTKTAVACDINAYHFSRAEV